ncbi:MAG: hypothetical protein E7168_04430 [Firmicutes bacterium]|nr:hypothetical protein [Bacillota bacterium]
MHESVIDQKCPSCRAPLKYWAKTSGWDCEYCGSHFNIDDLQKVRVKKKGLQEKKLSGDGYTCKNCGASILASENTSATTCVYCRSTAILANRIEEEFTPNSIIPFKKTKEEAIQAFQKMGLRKLFVPKAFTSKKNIKEIQGIYIPFWLFDFNLQASISGTGVDIKTWRSGDYAYTKKDEYHFEREGNFPFYDIPVDGSKHFDNALMNSIEPFNYKDFVEFDTAYLSGFLAEKYDLTKDEVENIAITRATTTAVDTFKESLRKYDNYTIQDRRATPSNIVGEYALLPVWLLNIKYKDKIYSFAMNGQTGKMIGNIPVHKGKVLLFFIIVSTLLIVLIILGFLMTGEYAL